MSRRRTLALTLMIAFCSLAAVFSAREQQTPSSRLLVWDGKNGALHALDPASGARLGAASVPAGALAATRDGGRLIAFWTDRRTGSPQAGRVWRTSI